MTFIETILTIGIVVGIVASFLGISILAFKVTDWLSDRTEAKRRREHPALYELFDAFDKKSTEYYTLRNSEVTPRMNQIDAILRDWNYYPLAVKEQRERRLEELRQDIEATKATLKIIANEKAVLREQIHDYVKQHNLEWAKKMGW